MRVVMVEDQRLLREVLGESLAARGVEVAGSAWDGASAADVIEQTRPDAVILDIRMPPTFTDEGIRIAELTRRRHPDIGIVVLSSYPELGYADRLLRVDPVPRAVGYLLKDRVGDTTQLIDSMRRVVDGEVVIDPSIITRLMNGRSDSDGFGSLTAHERRILALVAEGRSNLGIAEHLGSRVSTIEKHLSVITQKLGLPAPREEGRAQVNVRVLAALTFLRGHDPIG